MQSILRDKLPRDAKVWVFGSRAKWTTKDSSDLDLAVDADRPLTRKETAALEYAFEESDLPYKVDVVDMHRVSDSFKAIIERDKVALPMVQSPHGGMATEELKTLKLGEVCLKIGSGATPRGGKDVYHESGVVALIRSQNVYNDSFDRSGLVYLLPEQATQLNNVEVHHGDVLLNITGDSVARVCQVPDDVLPARVNQHVAIIRPDPRKLHPRFLRFFLVSPQMQAHMLGLAAAGATRNALTKGMIEGFDIPSIPLHSQKLIADLLGVLEDKIDLNRRMNETLEATARLFFKDWFVDFGPTRAKAEGRPPYLAPDLWALFPDALDDDDKPMGWKPARLGDIAEGITRTVDPSEVEPETPYIGLEHMPRRSIALDSWEGAGKVTSGKLHFRRGEFLFGKLRPYFHKVGVTPIDGICSTDIVVCKPKREVAYGLLLSLISSDEFVAYTDQTSTGTKMPRTSWSIMARYEITLPPAPILEAFNNLLTPWIELLCANIHESRTLSQTRDLLLPKLMSGEIRLQEAEELVEAVA